MEGKIVLSESNLEEIVKKINEFCKEGFHYTHDWLKYPDREDRTFNECKFEDEFPKYQYHSGAKWVQGEFYNKEPMIHLKTQQHSNVFLIIQLDSEILFTKDAIFCFKENFDKYHVGKIYV